MKFQNMSERLRVAAVSYLNTKPLTYALENGGMSDRIDLQFLYPSKLAEALVSGHADIGLLPVAMIPHLENPTIITGHCIATNGEVASVCIFSDVPIEEIESLYLDYQSRTSVLLTKLLLKDYWKLNLRLLPTDPGFEAAISGKNAALIIGDRALEQRSTSKYIYDLGLAWKAWTGLPFVFAVWVANKPVDATFEAAFNEQMKIGLSKIDTIVADNPYHAYDLKKYYTENISYTLDEEKRESLALFLKKINNL